MLQFRVDVLPILKARGITAADLREITKFGSATVQKLRHRQICSMHELVVLCGLLGMQPGELIQYIPGDDPPEE